MNPLWKIKSLEGYTPSIIPVEAEFMGLPVDGVVGVGLRISPLSLSYDDVRNHWKKLREEQPNDGDFIFAAELRSSGSREARVCFGKVSQIFTDHSTRLTLNPYIDVDIEANILKKFDRVDSVNFSTPRAPISDHSGTTKYWINVEDVARTLLSGNYKIDLKRLRKAVDSEQHPTSKALEIMKFFDANYCKAISEMHSKYSTVRMISDTASRKGTTPFDKLNRDAVDDVLHFVTGSKLKGAWRTLDLISSKKANRDPEQTSKHPRTGGRRSRKIRLSHFAPSMKKLRRRKEI